jgi:hypothetical protein
MTRTVAAALLFALSSAPAFAAPPAAPPAPPPGELRFLEELRVEPSKGGTRIGADLQKLDPGRFIKVGMEWERDAKNRPTRPRFKVLDLQQRRVVEVVIPLEQLPRAATELLGQAPPPELVHHDGERTSMIFRESRNSKEVAKYFCQYDHRAGRFSELVRLGDLNASRFLHPIGFDPQEEHFYFAFENYPPGDKEKKGPASLDLSRIGLKTLAMDWQMTLELPKRKRQLAIKGKHFSHDGRRLALVEHSERSYPIAIPPQQVYVLDLEKRTIDAFPTPLSAYGGLFARDDRSLLLGSNELGEIIRINLAQRRIDLRAKGITLINGLALTPSGRSLLVFANTILASPKVVEVRRADTLVLRTSIPVRLLFPGQDGVHLGFVSSEDGRMLVSPIPDASGFPAGNGVRIYEVPDDVESPAVAGTSPEALRRAQGAVAARLYADQNRIQLSIDPAEEARTPAPSFSPIVVAAGGDVVFTGTRSGNSDDDYKPGRTKPVVVRLDPSGKRRWEVVLAKEGFLDHTGARVAATADGGCVAQIFSYVNPGRYPNTRLVKLDAKGKTLWELQLRGGGDLDTPLADRLELLPDESISLGGRIYPARNVEKKWRAVVSAEGKVLSDVTGD